MKKIKLPQLREFFFASVDTVRLDAFRMCLAASMLLYFADWWKQGAEEWLTTEGFHISKEALPYHPWYVAPLSPEFLPWFGMLLFGSLTAVMVGWQARWTVWLALGVTVYATLVDQLSAFTLNKLAIAGFLVLALATKGHYWSIERGSPQKQSVWPIRILQITLILQYFTAGWSKAAYGDWLGHPYVFWEQLHGFYRTDLAAWLLREIPKPGWGIVQWLGLIFELLSPALFGFPALRVWGFMIGGIFQILVALTMYKLIYFSLVMFCFYVVFIPDPLLHRIRLSFRGIFSKKKFAGPTST
ncbi:MAG: hypothetical protein A3D10_05135 [Omnitrophica WOR_2 bacterium RIFCSPHIGHO2_02_FULL_48_11]|nr:MAG: hypothetical protein A3D10_05135 [Omnitrophica WOR_2 bacterium RIFCSPHIGHO2_02_FULL_48_11]